MKINSISNTAGSLDLNAKKVIIKIHPQGYLGYASPALQFDLKDGIFEKEAPDEGITHTSSNLGISTAVGYNEGSMLMIFNSEGMRHLPSLSIKNLKLK